jgi:hypothetical protein
VTTEASFLRVIACIVLSLIATGCSEEQPRHEQAEARSGLSKDDANESWLAARDDTEPDAWLIEREKAMGADISAQDAKALRQTLTKASAHFKETPRMIANRALQLETMLKPEGERETAVSLISRLTDAIGEPSRIDGFGAAGQQYYNLRKTGLSSEKAISELSKRYAPRS